jgi:hypothetical protein
MCLCLSSLVWSCKWSQHALHVWDCCWGDIAPSMIGGSFCIGCCCRASWCALVCAAIAWCTCQGVHVFLWNLLSFLAFHIYHIVVSILVRRSSVIEVGITVCRMSCTPSLSWGRLSVRRGGLVKNQTTLGSWQRKNRCASSSTAPQTVQCLSIWVLYLDALSPVGSALPINLQVKALISGGRFLLFQAFCKMRLAWWLMLRDAYCGSWIRSCLLRCL